MEKCIVPTENEFRMNSIDYEGEISYNIEQYRKDKWRLVAGGFSFSQARTILKLDGGGEELVRQMKKLTIRFICIAVALIIILIITINL